tara:strand:+ start:1192 stop:1308 length:117 start_codon:yes stop_codon:yes gene_type:complete
MRSVPTDTRVLDDFINNEPLVTCGHGTSDKVVFPFERF